MSPYCILLCNYGHLMQVKNKAPTILVKNIIHAYKCMHYKSAQNKVFHKKIYRIIS